MIGIHDLVVVQILKESFKFLSENPNHLEYILCGFNSRLRKLVGEEYFNECMDYVLNNRIVVQPYYQLDAKKDLSISVMSYGNEDTQYIGDFGSYQSEYIEGKNSPIVYAEFDVKKIEKDEFTIPPGYVKRGQIWPRQIIESGDRTFAAKILFVDFFEENGLVGATVTLDKTIPKGLSPKKWVSRSYGTKTVYEIGSSVDNVNIDCVLQTVGDPAIMRLIGLVVRWAIKFNRLTFDNNGLQLSTFSYSPISLVDGSDNMFQQVFTISAKSSDTWIINENESIDASGKNELCVIASRLDGDEESDVPLGESDGS